MLIGVRRSEPARLSSIAWATADVLAQTRGRRAELGWRCRELPVQ